MKILAFSTSTSLQSINKQLVEYALLQFTLDTIDFVSIKDYEMPLYSVDIENTIGIPDLAMQFAEKIDQADLLILSLAEHNGSYTAAFKNLFDWVSRIPNRKPLGNKNVLLLSTSPGARGGASVMAQAQNSFPHFGSTVVGSFSLPSFQDNFDKEKGITDRGLLTEFNQIIEEVKMSFQKEL